MKIHAETGRLCILRLKHCVIQCTVLSSLPRHRICIQLTQMGRRTLTLFFGSAKTKSKTETTTSLNSWILCLEGYWLTDSSLPLCFKVEHISLLKPEFLKLFLFHLFFKVFRDARKVSSRVSAVGADLWSWLGGRRRPDRRDSHWPGEQVLQSTQSYLWTPGWVQPVSLGAFIQPE